MANDNALRLFATFQEVTTDCHKMGFSLVVRIFVPIQ
jgi:hypothetical protein